MATTHKTIPAEDIRPGDVLVIDSITREVTRVQPFGTIGYGTKPGRDVYLRNTSRVTFFDGDRVTMRDLIARPLHALAADHSTDDVVWVNGRAVVHNGDEWVWQDSGKALDFDACERYGLDGSGRCY